MICSNCINCVEYLKYIVNDYEFDKLIISIGAQFLKMKKSGGFWFYEKSTQNSMTVIQLIIQTIISSIEILKDYSISFKY